MSRRKKRSTDAVGQWWSESQKLEAAKMYLVTGSYALVSTGLGIPYQTLNKWKYTQWWKTTISELKAEGSVKLSAKLSQIAEKALDVTLDRLDNGNFQLDQKTGEVRRIPVNMKDAAKVATDLMAQQQKLEDKPVQQQIEATVDSRLAKLAEQFAQFAKQAKPQIEAKPVETVYEVVQDGVNSSGM